MKKTLIALVVAAITIIASVGYGQDLCRAGSEQTASAAIVTGGGKLCGITIATDGTNAVTLNIYDNTAGSGTKLIPTRVIPSSATNRGWSWSSIPAIPFNVGLYVSVAVADGGTVAYIPYIAPR